jgi:hypothetical protein
VRTASGSRCARRCPSAAITHSPLSPTMLDQPHPGPPKFGTVQLNPGLASANCLPAICWCQTQTEAPANSKVEVIPTTSMSPRRQSPLVQVCMAWRDPSQSHPRRSPDFNFSCLWLDSLAFVAVRISLPSPSSYRTPAQHHCSRRRTHILNQDRSEPWLALDVL